MSALRDTLGSGAPDLRPPGPRNWDLGKGELAGVVWFTLLFVAAIGIANGASDQPSYLPPGLRIADPGFLVGDWYTWDVRHSHHVFALLVAGLAETGHLVLGLTVGAIIQSAGFALALYAMMRAVYDRPLEPWAMSLALFAALGTTSLADTPLLEAQLDASALAGSAVAVALGFVAWRKILPAAIALGLAGLLHAHYAVLVLPILVAVTYVIGTSPAWEKVWREWATLWVTYLAISLPTFLTITRFAAAPGAERAHRLSMQLFPESLAPWSWSIEPFALLCAAVLLGVGGMVLCPPRKNRELGYCVAAIGATVFLSLGLGLWPRVQPLLEAWPWRLSPFVLVAGFAAGAAGFAGSEPFEPGEGPPGRMLGVGSALTALVVIARMGPAPLGEVLLILCALPLAGWMVSLAPHGDRRPGRSRIMRRVVVTIAFAPVVVSGISRSHFEIRPERPQRAPLYRWIAAETPAEGVFAVPPSWEDFRLVARRPVVADWKAVPRYPPDRVEWAERIRALTGIEGLTRRETRLDSAYSTMSCDRARELRDTYGVRYVVHRTPKELPCGREVYEDSLFQVWELPPLGANRGGEPPVRRPPRP